MDSIGKGKAIGAILTEDGITDDTLFNTLADVLLMSKEENPLSEDELETLADIIQHYDNEEFIEGVFSVYTPPLEEEF